jgi:D-serine deaminase-like pyridoxal phosphate-dependent protein
MSMSSKWDLDTPALCVDLDRLDANIEKMQTRLAAAGVGARPHAKTHKCPAVAERQLAAGAVGICVAKVSEAEALAAHGIEPILMTTANVTPAKIRRAMAIRAANPRFIQAVDYAPNARDLNDAANAAGIVADVVVDVAIGTRSGVPAGRQALELAQLVDTMPNLTLRGVISYDGAAQHVKGFEARRAFTLARFAATLETLELFKRSGLSTEIVSGGGTGTYDIMSGVAGVTDVQVGSYVFMDAQYLAIGGASGDAFADFPPSLTVIATVVNAYFPGKLTTDAGAKALTVDTPAAIVIGEPGFRYDASSDEFGVITCESASRPYAVGDRLEMIVPHCDPVVNLYDRIHATRGSRVEAIWPIAARGRSQ